MSPLQQFLALGALAILVLGSLEVPPPAVAEAQDGQPPAPVVEAKPSPAPLAGLAFAQKMPTTTVPCQRPGLSTRIIRE